MSKKLTNENADDVMLCDDFCPLYKKRIACETAENEGEARE